MKQNNFLAFDIGASSGRAMLFNLEDGSFSAREIHRFPNHILEINGRFYWNIYALYQELLLALGRCGQENISLTSIGIDTWGVDFGLIGEDGTLLALPRSYRDPYTAQTPDLFFREIMPQTEVYERTGIQFLQFNTLFQLYQAKKDRYSPLQHASKLLFVPDLLSYLLTGNMVCEYTIASTGQILRPGESAIDSQLLEAAGISPSLFPPLVMPGTPVGHLTPALGKKTGVGEVPVVAVAGHDTASAVAAIPTPDREFAFLSSGTWSLMGIETDRPIITPAAYQENFTNEGGIDGSIRFLKNITGMWLLERCREEWKQAGKEESYATLIRQAQEAEAFRSLVNPNASCFNNPPDMQTAICEYCRETGQAIPQTQGQFVRCILESLALSYRKVLTFLQQAAPFPIRRLHIIGGGAQNDFLNQLTADIAGIPVVAGPAEATAIGNGFLQARAAGLLANRWEMRESILRNIRPKEFQPQVPSGTFNSIYHRFLQLTY